MAKTELNIIKNWFKTGLKPTQAQFWATWDSFWHKDEKLPISAVENLGTILDNKADNIHEHTQYATNDATSLTDANVINWQEKLKPLTVILLSTPYQVIKRPSNSNHKNVETGDVIVNVWIDESTINSLLIYNEGDPNILESWNQIGSTIEEL